MQGQTFEGFEKTLRTLLQVGQSGLQLFKKRVVLSQSCLRIALGLGLQLGARLGHALGVTLGAGLF